MKAIPTEYRGILYRSRTEARWAAFFDEMRIDAVYEGEGFDLGGVMYLPDFYLPKAGAWLEVKGTSPTDDEVDKAYRLAMASQRPVVMAIGHPTTDSAAFNLLVWGGRQRVKLEGEPGKFCDEGRTLITIAAGDTGVLVEVVGKQSDLNGSPHPYECLDAARAVQDLRFGVHEDRRPESFRR